jgi:hypothetical protein
VPNPKNPESPARNTRSSLNGGGLPSNFVASPTDSEASGHKHSRGDTSSSWQVYDEEEVLRCSKRRLSSVQSPTGTPAITKGSRPLGILSSKKKAFSSQRSVAFGSPEAAEYNIGSPSISLTPMPRGRAKALYRLPIGTENNGSEFSNGQMELSQKRKVDGDETMDIESDLNVLVDKITVENMNNSPELSPIAKNKSDTGVFDAPVILPNTTRFSHAPSFLR